MKKVHFMSLIGLLFIVSIFTLSDIAESSFMTMNAGDSITFNFNNLVPNGYSSTEFTVVNIGFYLYPNPSQVPPTQPYCKFQLDFSDHLGDPIFFSDTASGRFIGAWDQFLQGGPHGIFLPMLLDMDASYTITLLLGSAPIETVFMDVWKSDGSRFTQFFGSDQDFLQPMATPVVPIPSAVLLLGFGLLRLANYRRRKSASSS
jgi:hypothetical protein